MPLKEQNEHAKAEEKRFPKQKMHSRLTESIREEALERGHLEKDTGKPLSSAPNDASPPGRGQKDGKKSPMDMLFKQFPQRSSLTGDESKANEWKREELLGKRGAEESRGVDTGLITDLKGLHKHERRQREQRQSKKRFISEYFGETGPRERVKRCIQFWVDGLKN